MTGLNRQSDTTITVMEGVLEELTFDEVSTIDKIRNVRDAR